MEQTKSEEIKLYTIYQIYSTLGNMIYDGSTKLIIQKRFKQHINDYTKYKTKSDKYVSSYKLFEKYGIQNCKIRVLEEKVCTKRERFQLEGEYTTKHKNDSNYDCVNEVVNTGLFVDLPQNVSIVGEFGLVNKLNTSGVAGVTFHKFSGLWRARISINGKRRELGDYPTKEEAINARLRKENSLLGKNHEVVPLIQLTELELLELELS